MIQYIPASVILGGVYLTSQIAGNKVGQVLPTTQAKYSTIVDSNNNKIQFLGRLQKYLYFIGYRLIQTIGIADHLDKDLKMMRLPRCLVNHTMAAARQVVVQELQLQLFCCCKGQRYRKLGKNYASKPPCRFLHFEEVLKHKFCISFFGRQADQNQAKITLKLGIFYH